MEITAVADGVFRLGRPLDRPVAGVVDPPPRSAALETAGGQGDGRARTALVLFDGAGLVASFEGLVEAEAAGRAVLRLRRADGGLEKTATRQVFWNVDPPAGHTASFNNLYTSIPFVLCLHDGRAHGVFYDHPGRLELDLGKADPDRVTVEAADDLVVYVLLGPTPADVLERYTALTGRTPMPPLWALGNQQSRWSYMSAEEVLAIAREFRAREIPCDVLYLDIDHMDGYRVFTWDRERFPDPAGLIEELRAHGFRVVTITDPGVKVDESYSVYTEGRERTASSASRARATSTATWCGRACARSPTSPIRAVREWWGSLAVGAARGGRRRSVVRHERAGDVRAAAVDDARGRGASRRRAGAAARRGAQRVRLADGGGGAGRAGAAAARRAAVRDLARRLRGPPAACAAVDGRQLVLVGAPVDEHAAAAEPRAVGDRVGGRRRRRLLRGRERRAARALDRVRHLPAVLPQPHGDGDGGAGAVGVRRAVGDGVPRDAAAADAARAVPVHAVRGVPPDRRPDPAAAAVRVSGRSDDVHGRRPVHGRRRTARRPDHPAGNRAPPRLPAGRRLGAVVDRRGRRGPGSRAGARAPGAAGHLRAVQHPRPDVARGSAHGRGGRLPHVEGVRGPRLGLGRPLRGRGRRVWTWLSSNCACREGRRGSSSASRSRRARASSSPRRETRSSSSPAATVYGSRRPGRPW